MMNRRILLMAVFFSLSLFTFARYRVKVMPYIVDETASYRAKWAAQGLTNYGVTVVQTGVIHPMLEWTSSVLIFHNNEYVYQKRPADCQQSSSTMCNYRLEHPRGYTINAYFDRAQQCINDSKSAYALLHPFDNDFHGYDAKEQLSTVDLSWTKFFGSRNVCAVVYDPVYGFPTQIVWHEQNTIDGMREWHITKVDLLTEEMINDPKFLSGDDPYPILTDLLEKIGSR